MPGTVFVGYDTRQSVAYDVCVASLRAHASARLDVRPIVESQVRARGLYRRVHERRDGRLWDAISEAPMATEFALTRFLVPRLCRTEWALFCDNDFLWRADVAALFAHADPRFAVMVVQHAHAPTEATKMDGQIQLAYRRKNWSSLVLWNCRHPAHEALADHIDTWPGRRLHGFEWLADADIGALPAEWNWLEGHSCAATAPKAVHYTRGTPDLPGYGDAAYADEWRGVRARLGAAKAPATAAAARGRAAAWGFWPFRVQPGAGAPH